MATHWQRVICKFFTARLICQVFSTVGLEGRARASTTVPLLQDTADDPESDDSRIGEQASHATLQGIIVEGRNDPLNSGEDASIVEQASHATLQDIIVEGDDWSNKAETVKRNTKDFITLRDSGGVQGIARLLKTDLKTGISGDDTEIHGRRFHGQCFAPAVAKEASSRSFFRSLYRHSNDWTVLLLVIAAAFSIGFGIKNFGPKTGWCVGIAVLGAAIILVLAPTLHDVWQNHLARKRRRANLLNKEAKPVKVLRGGASENVSVTEVVLGDIVVLAKDSLVPSDGLFISGEDLVVNDGLETEKTAESPFLFYGAVVSHGTGNMLVTAVGTGTVLGEGMKNTTNSDNDISRLPPQLDNLRKLTNNASLVIAILIIVVVSLGLMLGGPSPRTNPQMPEIKGRSAGSKEFMDIIHRLVMETAENMRSVKTPFALFLLGVLEGMPFMISLAAFYWMWKMPLNTASVSGLLDCINMDSAATIFIDVTPLNSTAATECVIDCDGNLTIDHLGSGIVRNFLCDGISAPLFVPSSRGCTAVVEDPLLSWAASNLDMKLDLWRQSRTIMKTKRLNSNEKGSGVLMKKAESGDDVKAHWKGPASTILNKSSSFLDKNGVVKPLDDDKKKSLETVIEDVQIKGLQAVGFAYKHSKTLEEDGLTLIAILGITCCAQKAELKALTNAGVKIVLVSDEDVEELKETATANGIFPQDGIAITGLDFQELDENQKMDKVDKISVMGNADPSDRLIFMQWRKKKEKGRVIAALGTRTSDAPLLKEADLGVAMGGWSGETAKESADIIVFDGMLTSLLTVMRCGRCTHLNIQKYVQVELVTNAAGQLIVAVTILSLGPSPITGIQLIWATVVITVVAGPALLLEPLRGAPPPQSVPLISKPMWRNILFQALYQSCFLLVLHFKFSEEGGFVNNSFIFNAFVVCQLFNAVNSRDIEKVNIFAGIYRSPWLLAAQVVSVGLQWVFVEASSVVAGTEKLGLKQWGSCFLIGLGSCLVDFGAKCLSNLVRAEPPSGEATMVYSASTDAIDNPELLEISWMSKMSRLESRMESLSL